MVEKTNTGAPKDKTPQKWDGPEDARSKKGSGVYPNYNTIRTRSGHVFTFDDSEDNESVTLQHRGGSMVQFMPDGAVQFVAQNGQYTFVFGENRVKITGAYDVVVDGAASLRVEGDYDVTVGGNYNVVVAKDYNVQAKNYNSQVRGEIDMNSKNFNLKVEGSSAVTSHGTTAIVSDGGVAIASTSQSVAIKGAVDVGIKAAGGNMMIESGGKTSVKAGGMVAADGSSVYLNSGKADPASVTLPKPVDPNARGR